MRYIELVLEVVEYIFRHTITHFRTRKFYVYELDFDYERWVPIESLGNMALSLGGNDPVSHNTIEDNVEEGGSLKKNSINFVDEFWDNKPYENEELVCSAVNYDCGIFNLEYGRI